MGRGALQARPWCCKELDMTERALCEVWELWLHLFGDCFSSPWQFFFVWPHGFHHFTEQIDIQPKTQGFYCRFLELFICAVPSSPYCVLQFYPLSSFSNFSLCNWVRFLGSMWFLSPCVVVWKLCEAEMWGDLAHNVFHFHCLSHYSLALPVVQA